MSGQKVIKATFWYTFSNILLKGLAFITMPIFSRILTKAEFGLFANYATWCSFLGVIVFSLQASLARGRFEFKDDLDSFASSLLVLGFAITILMDTFLIGQVGFFSSLFVLEKKYVFIMCIVLLLNPAYDFFLSMQRLKYNYKTVAVLSISTAVLSVCLSLTLIFTMRDRLLAKILGNVIPLCSVSVVIYIHYLRRSIHVRLRYWKYSLLICIPYIFHVLSHGILGQSDRAMITSFCGAEDTALYSLAYNIALAINIFSGAMNNSFAPWLGEKLNLEQYASIRKYSYPYLAVFTVLIVGLLLTAPETLYILGGKQYMEAKYVMPPVILGCYFGFMYGFYINIEQFEKKTLGMAIATSAAAGMNILTNWIFIPRFGYIAAAYTTLFCYLLLWLFHYLLVRRIGLSSIYDTRYFLIVSGVVAMIMFASIYLYDTPLLRYMFIVLYLATLTSVGLRKKKQVLDFWRR